MINSLMYKGAKHLPKIRALMRAKEDSEIDSDGTILGQMYDFYKNYDDEMAGFGMQEFDELDLSPEERKQKDKRIEASPKSVVNELQTIPTPFTLENLDEKIEMFKDKSLLSNQHYVKQQIDGFLKRLENRKRYREEVEFYSQFPNTIDEKIDALLSKYKLVMKTSDLFVPTFPKDAIDVMKKYSEVTKRITKEKPVYYVIAEAKDFKKKTERLDPILLAQSPFGFYFQILGAWDAEMLLLHEL